MPRCSCGRSVWMVGKNLFQCVDPECRKRWNVDKDGLVRELNEK